MERRWLGVLDVEERVRRVLRIPSGQAVEVKHANFAKIVNQKFYVRFGKSDLLVSFFTDANVARKESLILDYLNDLQSEALEVDFAAPKKIYHRNGIVIRERFEGEVLRPSRVSDETLRKIARLLLLFQKTPVRKALREYPQSFAKMRDWVLRQIPQAKESFTPFRGSAEAFDQLALTLKWDWSRSLRRQRKNFVHGDMQPQNILTHNGQIALIDFDRGGHFYSLIDAASFAVQFTHVALLEQYHQGKKPDRRHIRRQREVFMKEYRRGLKDLNQPLDDDLFRIFKLLIISNGLAFSTAGFRKKVTRGHKHLLFGLFRQELKQLI